MSCSLIQGYPIDIRAAKVVAGLEPENTNIFLIALAECASDRNLDNEQAVRRTLQGEEPGQGAKPTRVRTHSCCYKNLLFQTSLKLSSVRVEVRVASPSPNLKSLCNIPDTRTNQKEIIEIIAEPKN